MELITTEGDSLLRNIIRCLFFVLFLLMTSVLCAEESKSSKDLIRYVSADSVGIKDKPSIRSKEFYTLSYAEVVVLEEENDKWSFVYLQNDPAVKGWVSTSALTKRKIVSNGKKRLVEADEIALAGKGLDKSLDDISEFQDDNFDIDKKNPIASIFKNVFGKTDEINYFEFLASEDEKSVSDQDLFDFIENGKLKLQEEE